MKFDQILILGHNLKEAPYLERVESLKLTQDVGWKSYILVIVAERLVSFFITQQIHNSW